MTTPDHIAQLLLSLRNDLHAVTRPGCTDIERVLRSVDQLAPGETANTREIRIAHGLLAQNGQGEAGAWRQ